MTAPPWGRPLHRCNALFLALFVAAHLANHLSGLGGIERYHAVQQTLRVVYRHPLVEPLLLASVLLQLVAGTALIVARWRQRSAHGFWGRLQIGSGIVFLLFMAQHLFSLGMARLYFDLDTNFYWPASVMSGPWFIYYFAPYYVLGVLSLFAHVGAGVCLALEARGSRRLGRRFALSLIGLGTAVSLAIPAIIAGVFFPIDLPAPWLDYLRFYAPGYTPW